MEVTVIREFTETTELDYPGENDDHEMSPSIHHVDGVSAPDGELKLADEDDTLMSTGMEVSKYTGEPVLSTTYAWNNNHYKDHETS